MHFTFFSLVSSEWGISRFITDLCSLAALAVLFALPWLLLKDKLKLKSLWADGSAISKRLD
tara:strand:- start:181 stop:363 length:183 start_codon:yes stop_codon:yes gene_type:complete